MACQVKAIQVLHTAAAVPAKWRIRRRPASTHHQSASSINDRNHNVGITAATGDNSQPLAISCDTSVKSRAPLRNPTARGAAPSSHALPQEMATWRMTSAPNSGKDQMGSERIAPPDFACILMTPQFITCLRPTVLSCAACPVPHSACGRAAPAHIRTNHCPAASLSLHVFCTGI
jgi:hypothetical protein